MHIDGYQRRLSCIDVVREYAGQLNQDDVVTSSDTQNTYERLALRDNARNASLFLGRVISWLEW
jgi:hypothetical protein